eukprot:191011-Amphidinium_carterae.1
MKLQRPSYVNLKQFGEQCVLPLCAVLRIRPFMLGRRAEEAMLRLSYIPVSVPADRWKPMFLFLATAELAEFSRALWQAAGVLTSCVYIAMNMVGCENRDADHDSQHGLAVRLMFRKALLTASKKLLLSTNVLMQLRMISPMPSTTPCIEQQDKECRSSISVSVHDDYAGFVIGGDRAGNSSTPLYRVNYMQSLVAGGMLRSTPSPIDAVVFVPTRVELDSVGQCLQLSLIHISEPTRPRLI